MATFARSAAQRCLVRPYRLTVILPLLFVIPLRPAAALIPTLPPCPVATPEPLSVEPIPGQTDALTLEVVVHAPGSDRVWIVIPQSGVFVAEGDFAEEPARVEVRLLPNTEHHLQVNAHVKTTTDGECRYGGEVVTTSTDADGMPLIIVNGIPTRPEITVEPAQLYLVCGDQSFDITIASSGPAGSSLVIAELAFHHAYSGGEYGTDFGWDLDGLSFPLTLPSGSAVTIPVRYESQPNALPSRLVLEVFSNAVNELTYLSYHGRPCGTPVPTRTCTPDSHIGSPVLRVESAEGAPGGAATVVVALDTDATEIAATENDLGFDALNAPIARGPAGRPDCTVDPSTGKQGFFAFHPIGCVGWECTSIRAIVISLTDVAPIPGGPLYSCRVEVPAEAAAGRYPLRFLEAGASTVRGDAVELATVDGEFVVTASGGPTPVASPTAVPVDPERDNSGFTGQTGGAAGGGGGCHIGAEPRRNTGPLVLAVVAAALSLLRRRRRAVRRGGSADLRRT